MPYCTIFLANGTAMATRKPAPQTQLGFGETGQTGFAAGPVLDSLSPIHHQLVARARPEALDELSQHGFSEDEVYRLVVPKRTLARRRAADELLTVDETDKALRLMRIAVQAEQVFGEPEKAHRWLRKPKRALNGETPVACLATEVGGRIVEGMLIRIEHGMFA